MGANALGFIFTKSPSQITPGKAREIITRLPPFICKVGVFKNEKIATVKKIFIHCFLDVAQFHGKEDLLYIRRFGPEAIKVFEMDGKHVLNEIKKFALPYFMLDLPKGENQMSLDWTIIREAKKYGKIILAGGLTPENLEECLQMATPYGVDVCRGVEKTKGKKCPEKLRQFIFKVKRWDMQRIQENSEFMGASSSQKF
jgi:phosphoribosylanthranilate isomerase